MVKLVLALSLMFALLAGCSSVPRTDDMVAGAAPKTISVKGTFEGLTEKGWLKIKVPETAAMLELELQKEVRPSFEAMNLKVGEAVWVHYYPELPRIAGIARVKQ